MCWIDLEPCDVWGVKSHRANKPHRCNTCGVTIQPGERYTAIFSVFEGEAGYERCCAACDTAALEFAAAHEDMRSQPSFLPVLLQECIAEGDREKARWQPVLDAIKARGPA